MASHLTAEEDAEGYTAAMGPELGKLFTRLWNECAWLHVQWNEFVALFGTKPERVDLLNAAAPGFGRIMQDALWNEILLHICRLTDQERVGGGGGKETLTLRRLQRLVAPQIQSEVKERMAGVDAAIRFARDWRDRYIGHRELRLALKETIRPLESASKQKVRDAILAIAAVLHTVERHYCHVTSAYEIADIPGNAEALLYVLRDGLEARKEYLRRLETGTLRPEEHRQPRPI